MYNYIKIIEIIGGGLYCVSKKRLVLLGIAFFVMMSISGIYALTTELKDVETTISTSAVEINITEYDSYNNEFNQNGKIVMPGEVISLVPRVHNLGVDCYLRTKITCTINNKKYNEFNYIDGNYKNWNKKGDYYYYSPIFTKNNDLDIFNIITIPTNLPDADQGKKVILNIVVEAIQAKHFDGDWSKATIKQSINKSYDLDDEGSSTIIYDNDVDRHITLDNGFFDNLGNLLPGDSKSEQVTVLNRSKTKNDYYLTLQFNNLTNEEKRLLNNINIIIKNNNKTLIENNILDFGKKSYISLKPNETSNLSFIVSLPKELDNSYSKTLTKITWKFSYEESKKDKDNQNDKDKKKNNIIIINPNTGDFKFSLSMIMFITSAIGMLIVIILLKKENNKNNIYKKEGEKI